MTGAEDSFIREILKVTVEPDIISFAGGLPNPNLFPVEAMAKAAEKVIRKEGRNVLQYSTTEGFLPLREYIADRYLKTQGLEVSAENILIVNGSQQGIDLVSKVILNKGDTVLMEEPGYLGAIQAISLYEPEYITVPLQDDGIDLELLEKAFDSSNVKFMYTVPSFQNPSGVTYSTSKRKVVAELVEKHGVVLLEDNPYGELCFSGNIKPPIKSYLGETSVLMGSFSKITVPGIRLGWVYAEDKVMQKLKIVKQAADLHSNYMAQRILYQFLIDNDLDLHVQRIKKAYSAQRDCMIQSMEAQFPELVSFTRPEGGMFLWGILPEEASSLELFKLAIQEKVAFVPGIPFHLEGRGENTFRLNFSNSSNELIETGISRLAKIINKYLDLY